MQEQVLFDCENFLKFEVLQVKQLVYPDKLHVKLKK